MWRAPASVVALGAAAPRVCCFSSRQHHGGSGQTMVWGGSCGGMASGGLCEVGTWETAFHMVPLVLPPAGSANIVPVPCWGPSSPLRPLCCLCQVMPWAWGLRLGCPLGILRLEFYLSQLGSFREINAFLVSQCFPNQEARRQLAISAPVTTGGNFSTVVRVPSASPKRGR